MGDSGSGTSKILWIVVLGLVFMFVPPFNLLLIPVMMLFEASPESVARSGQPIAQAICDYRADHGLLPERLGDLAPTYLPETKTNLRRWSWDFSTGRLLCRAAQPHSYIEYWFTGPQAGEWRLGGESSKRLVSVPGPSTKPTALTGEALQAATLKEYERRITRHKNELGFYADKVNFIGRANRADLLREECERDAKLFPGWWLPQLALAKLEGPLPQTLERLDIWIRDHGSFNNYWHLARFHRDHTNTVLALENLSRSVRAPVQEEPENSPWPEARLFFDACQFAYEQGEYELVCKLARRWDEAGTTQKDWLAFQAAAELKLGQFDAATQHAARIANIAKHYAIDAGNVTALLKAADSHDSNFVYNAGSPGPSWVLFKEPRP